jgi:serine/threonine protein kinase
LFGASALEFDIGDQVAGVRLEELLSHEPTLSVFRGLSNEQLSVVVKIAFLEGDTRLSHANQMRCEHDLLTGPLVACPGVPRVLAFEKVGNDALALVELPVGVTLDTAIRRIPPHDRRGVLLNWGQCLYTILSGIHDRDVLHRDVKPSNIIIDGDALHFIDFGIACRTSEVAEAGWCYTDAYADIALLKGTTRCSCKTDIVALVYTLHALEVGVEEWERCEANIAARPTIAELPADSVALAFVRTNSSVSRALGFSSDAAQEDAAKPPFTMLWVLVLLILGVSCSSFLMNGR